MNTANKVETRTALTTVVCKVHVGDTTLCSVACPSLALVFDGNTNNCRMFNVVLEDAGVHTLRCSKCLSLFPGPELVTTEVPVFVIGQVYRFKYNSHDTRIHVCEYRGHSKKTGWPILEFLTTGMSVETDPTTLIWYTHK